MRVYVLRFATLSSLHGAFQVLAESERVATCTIEPELSRVRFLAPVRYADALVQRIYLEGGLAWCSRHDVEEHPGLRLPKISSGP